MANDNQDDNNFTFFHDPSPSRRSELTLRGPGADDSLPLDLGYHTHRDISVPESEKFYKPKPIKPLGSSYFIIYLNIPD